MTSKREEALPEAAVVAESETVVAEDAGGDLGSLLRAPSSRAPAAGAAVVLGKIVAVTPGGGVCVECPGVRGVRAARLATPLTPAELLAAMRAGRSAVLAFENGDPALPIIIALMQPPAAELVPGSPGAPNDAAMVSERDTTARRIIEAEVDGKRVRIVAEDEIVLECGSASITLRRNGRVVVRGTYVETYSDGTNRIKGGQVRIN